jgi:hypothetical protein
VEDALFLDVHPLADAETFTWEVIFRPDAGGAAEQRFFHFQENGTDTRMLFEIRVIDGKWCLDSYAQSGTESKALMDREKLHTLGVWHHAAAVYASIATTSMAYWRARRNCVWSHRARGGPRSARASIGATTSRAPCSPPA